MEKIKKIIITALFLFFTLLPSFSLAETYKICFPTNLYIEGCGRVDMVEVYTYSNYKEVIYHCGFKTVTVYIYGNDEGTY